MRVAYVSLAPYISGAERSLQITVRAALLVGIEPLIICPPGSPLAGWCRFASVPYAEAPLALRDRRHPIRWMRSVRALVKLLDNKRIEVVHSNQLFSYPAVSVAAKKLGIPRVCHIRDETTETDMGWWFRAGVEAVLCVSEHICHSMPPLPVVAGRGPVIKSMLNPIEVPVSSESWKRAEGQSVVFGFAGQLIPSKGLVDLLDALALLPDRLKWRLLVAGKNPQHDSSYERLTRDKIDRHGFGDAVTLLGFVDNMHEFYSAIDVLVVPSLYEPLGRVPLEAAAHGVPSVAFAVGGLLETIDDKRNGWLVEPGNIVDLGERLRSLIENQAQIGVAGGHAKQFVASVCDPTRYAASLLDLYGSLRRR